MDKITGKLDSRGIRIFVLAALEENFFVNIFCYSFICSRCVGLVPVNYRLCLVIVRTKVLQNRRLVSFSKKTNCWCAFG